jgi:hypothetical protein
MLNDLVCCVRWNERLAYTEYRLACCFNEKLKFVVRSVCRNTPPFPLTIIDCFAQFYGKYSFKKGCCYKK